MPSKFFDYTGVIKTSKRKRQGQTLSADDVADQDKLFKSLQDVMERLTELEQVAGNRSIEVEVTTPSYGFVTINHNFGGPVRWYPVWVEETNNTIRTTSGLKDSEPKLLTTYKYDFDFTTLSTGFQAAATFLTNTAVGNTRGLTFTRPSASTVQTSASTLVKGGTSNQAAIGNRTSDTANRGLVIQNKTVNLIGDAAAANNSPRNMATTGAGRWTAGLNVVSTFPYADSPDGTGTGCTRQVVTLVAGNGYAPYLAIPTLGANSVTSFWLKSTPTTGTAPMCVWEDGTPSANDYAAGSSAVVNTWARYTIKRGAQPIPSYIIGADTRDYSAAGGLTAASRDCLVDFAMHEHGDFPTEASETGVFARYGDVVTYATGSELIADNGQIKFYAKFTPKFSSTMQVPFNEATTALYEGAWALFSWGAAGSSWDNYAYILDSNKRLFIRLAGGLEYFSLAPIRFSQYQVVEVFIQCGNALPTIAMYRLNGSGTWVDLVMNTTVINEVPAPGTAAVRIMGLSNILASSGDNDTKALPCWLHRLSFYNTGLPSGISQPVQANHSANLTFNRSRSTADTLVLNSYSEVKTVIRVEG